MHLNHTIYLLEYSSQIEVLTDDYLLPYLHIFHLQKKYLRMIAAISKHGEDDLDDAITVNKQNVMKAKTNSAGPITPHPLSFNMID